MVQILGWFNADRSSRLPSEAFQRLRIARQFVGQKFQRDEAAQLGVFGFVNHAHAPAAELFDDKKMRNDTANERRGIWHVTPILDSG
jgi:hypothetical protein